MENSQEEISLESAIFILKNILKEKGYPENCFFEKQKLFFSYKELIFDLFIPIIIKYNSQPLLIIDYKPQENLTISERGITALARLLFNPSPYFALITNLKEFILINIYTGDKIKGGKEIIPEFKAVKDYKPEIVKKFDTEIEKKILVIYLSGG